MGENRGSGSGEEPGTLDFFHRSLGRRPSVAMSSRPDSGSAVPGAIDASSVRRTIGASPDPSGTAGRRSPTIVQSRAGLATVDRAIVEACIRLPLPGLGRLSSWALLILSRVVVKPSVAY